jgi:hypothetical protein
VHDHCANHIPGFEAHRPCLAGLWSHGFETPTAILRGLTEVAPIYLLVAPGPPREALFGLVGVDLIACALALDARSVDLIDLHAQFQANASLTHTAKAHSTFLIPCFAPGEWAEKLVA